MKVKKSRHGMSSEESEVSNDSVESISSSESESDDSSANDRHKHKKKRKRANSDSESDSEEHYKKSKKRKHKKKKKRHSKKKRRDESEAESGSDASSVSEGEISHKKRKHKHKSHKRRKDSSDNEDENGTSDQAPSVVRDHLRLSDEDRQPSRTYYQKEYKRSPSGDVYTDQRQYEVQRFYRGSSKDTARQNYQQQNYREQRRSEQYEDRRMGQGGDFHRPGPREAPWRKEHHDQGHGRGGYHHHHPGGDYRGGRRPDGPGREFHQQRRDQGQHYREFQDRRHHEEQNRGRDFRRGRPERQDRPPQPRNYPPRDPRQEREQSRRYEDKRSKEEEFRDQTENYRVKEQKPFDKEQGREERQKEEKGREERGREERVKEERGREETIKEDREREERGRGERKEREDRNGRNREEQSRERKPERSRDCEASPKRARRTRFNEGEDKGHAWGKTELMPEGKEVEKEKPNFGLSGKLTADANTVNGVVIKYTEPDDAKQPKRRWRFYPFKGDKALPILYIHRQTCFLMGREKKVVDIHLEHPSVSKQHAALQYRAVPFKRDDGTQGRRVRPYVIDLESANGTFVNNKKIEARRYVELMERDVVKFGFSQREYVLLHENSKDDHQDDDNQENPEEIGANIVTTAQIKREKRAKLEQVEDGE